MSSRRRRGFRCMPELVLLMCFNKSLKNRLRRKSSCRKINKSFKRFIRITSSMSFIRKFNSQFLKLKELLINMLLFYKRRRNRPAEWPTLRKKSKNFFKSRESKTRKSPQLKTPSSRIPLKKWTSWLSNWGKSVRKSPNQGSKVRWSDRKMRSQTSLFLRKISLPRWRSLNPKMLIIIRGNFLLIVKQIQHSGHNSHKQQARRIWRQQHFTNKVIRNKWYGQEIDDKLGITTSLDSAEDQAYWADSPG